MRRDPRCVLGHRDRDDLLALGVVALAAERPDERRLVAGRPRAGEEAAGLSHRGSFAYSSRARRWSGVSARGPAAIASANSASTGRSVGDDERRRGEPPQVVDGHWRARRPAPASRRRGEFLRRTPLPGARPPVLDEVLHPVRLVEGAVANGRVAVLPRVRVGRVPPKAVPSREPRRERRLSGAARAADPQDVLECRHGGRPYASAAALPGNDSRWYLRT